MLAFFFLLSLYGSLSAQVVRLGEGEIKTLKNWLVSDTNIVNQYQLQKQIADQALTEAPHPIDTIRTEGLLQGNPLKTATALALKDMRKIYALALLYKVNGNHRYLEQAVRYLTAWASVDKPRGDPIDDTNLDPIIEAYDMLKANLSAADEKIVRDWLKATAAVELSAVFNRPNRATSYNNWHSHRLKIVGEVAFSIGDTAFQSYTIRGMREQIGRNLLPDGSSADFVTRDALHYHVYDLEPLLTLAIVLKRATGIDYYAYVAPSGSSLKKSVDWLLPYITGEKTHEEFVHSTVEFDRQRAQNGEAAYKAGNIWDRKNGVATLLLAAWFDPLQRQQLLPLARQVIGTEAVYPAWQAVVNALENEGADIIE